VADATSFCAVATMKSLADEFLALKSEQRRVVHFALCEYALHKWNQYVSAQEQIQYIESVVGTQQKVDTRLPLDAFESAKHGIDSKRVNERYLEPMAAMQDDDLTFPENITYAYYAVYNLFKKYVQGEIVDDWLIVNQAVSSEENSREWQKLLTSAIQRAVEH
jgi:hypothetical protein